MVLRMAARAPARSRSAALAIALVVGWTACGHDTLRLLPADDDTSSDGVGNEPPDSGSPPNGPDLDAGADADANDGDVFVDHTDGFGGSNNNPPHEFDAGGQSGSDQGGAPNCIDESCGPCPSSDLECWRCLYVSSCDFRPSENCLDEWRALGCAQCSAQVPCAFAGQSCHLPTNRCLPSCETSEDCTVGNARKCDLEDGVCVECLGNRDCCLGDDCNRVCHYGRCFQCSVDSDCGDGEVCVQGRCFECLNDTMCPWDEPRCYVGTCRECITPSDCYPGETCNRDLGFCY